MSPTRPRIAVVTHRRESESVLGPHVAAVVPEPYLDHVSDAGGDPIMIWSGMSQAPLDIVNGVMLIGGGDIHPTQFGSSDNGDSIDSRRDSMEFGVVKECRARSIPLLGMCRGAQAINVALGGTLKRVADHRQEQPLSRAHHKVEVGEGSRLARLVGSETLEVNSFHNWAVDRPGQDLAVVGRDLDGTIESIESIDGSWWCVGIQWHAELLDADHTRSLFGGFVQAARGER